MFLLVVFDFGGLGLSQRVSWLRVDFLNLIALADFTYFFGGFCFWGI